MENLIEEVNSKESYVFAKDLQEYYDFVEWLDNNGAIFSYHFGSGEAFLFNGKMLLVYGL